MKKFVAELISNDGKTISRLLVKEPRYENGVFKAIIIGNSRDYSKYFDPSPESEVHFCGGIILCYEPDFNPWGEEEKEDND